MQHARCILKQHKYIFSICSVLLLLCLFYPTNLHFSCDSTNNRRDMALVHATEKYGRFVNTALQIALPLVMRDAVGLQQLVVVAITATAMTHGLKRALNDVDIMETRLGQRPCNAGSKHNMPSGHSSLAASGAYFVCRRYGLRYAFVVVPILILTMHARVALDAHSMSAVLAGALIGLLTTAMFTTRLQPRISQTSATLNDSLPGSMGQANAFSANSQTLNAKTCLSALTQSTWKRKRPTLIFLLLGNKAS